MSMSNKTKQQQQQQQQHRPMAVHLVAGGAAGLVESSLCHPFDTVKTRLQLQQSPSLGMAATAPPTAVGVASIANAGTNATNATATATPSRRRRAFSSVTTTQGLTAGRPPVAAAAAAVSQPMQPPTGAVGMARSIVAHEGIPSLYKGLTAVWSAVVPKMSIRFVSFEWYRNQLGSVHRRHYAPAHASSSSSSSSSSSASSSSSGQQYPRSVNFVAGLASGLTEAVLVVTPAEVCKIRMQSQRLQPLEPDRRKYTHAAQTATVIVREEGIGALWRGVVPTMMRQGCNQAVNFTTYNAIKDSIVQYRRENGGGNKADTYGLKPHESLILGGLSGGLGPIANNPLDVVKTRQQRQIVAEGISPKYHGVLQSCLLIAKEEGTSALWKGIGPRLARIMPGQAITFATYEIVSKELSHYL